MGVVLAAFTVVLPFLINTDPLAQSELERLERPSLDHLLGTDGFGRDVFVRVVFGTRSSLLVALSAIVASSLFGVPIGGISALSKRFDRIVGRLVDLLIGVPFLILLLIFIVGFGPHVVSLTLGLSITLLPRVVRFSRGSMLAHTNEPFVEAAIVSGASNFAVFRRHLLRNAMPAIIAYLAGLFGTAVLAETSLSFLGLGIPAPYPSLGGMLKDGARLYLETAPWLTIFPGASIAFMVLVANLIGTDFGKRVDQAR